MKVIPKAELPKWDQDDQKRMISFMKRWKEGKVHLISAKCIHEDKS